MKITNLLFTALLLLALGACSNDDDTNQEPDNHEEVITTLILNFTTQGVTNSYTYKVIDGEVVQHDQISLDPGFNYTLTLSFLNEEENPVDNITEEIREEGDEHLVCFDVSTGLDATYTISDSDVNGLDLGLVSDWQMGENSEGTLTVSLKHQPDLKSDPVNCSVGETDIEVPFTLYIE